MRTIHSKISLLAVLVGALAVPGESRGDSGDEALVVVVHKDSPLRDISATELRNLFRSSQGVVSGQKSIPINQQEGSAARRLFDRVVHGWSPSEAARFWTDRRIRGGSPPPKELGSSKHVQMYVYKYPKLIGYVPASSFRPDKLRALTVDGVSFDDPSYALRAN